MDSIIMLDDDEEEEQGGGMAEPLFYWAEEDILNLMGEPTIALDEDVVVETVRVDAGESVTVRDGNAREEKEATLVEADQTLQALPLKAQSNELISKALQHALASMTLKVEQRQVLQVARVRSTLKRSHECNAGNFKDLEMGGYGKKQRVFDAARSEAAKRRKSTELVRVFANVLRQLMQHKWGWPFLQPVDVKGLQLHDYYKVIRRPMDLGTIKSRMEAKDGTGYQHVREMCEDVRLVFRNAMLYNESWTDVYKMAKTLSQKFEEKWKTAIEPKLLEEEEKSCDDQLEGLMLEIAELHAAEEQASKQFSEDVLSQLSSAEQQLEGLISKLLSKCRTMTTEQRKELSQKFQELPCSSLNRLVEIMPSSKLHAISRDKIQIDFEALDPATLWRLHFFIKMVMESKGRLLERDKLKSPIKSGCEEKLRSKSEECAAGPSHGL